jgi:hypothetical protein
MHKSCLQPDAGKGKANAVEIATLQNSSFSNFATPADQQICEMSRAGGQVVLCTPPADRCSCHAKFNLLVVNFITSCSKSEAAPTTGDDS